MRSHIRFTSSNNIFQLIFFVTGTCKSYGLEVQYLCVFFLCESVFVSTKPAYFIDSWNMLYVMALRLWADFHMLCNSNKSHGSQIWEIRQTTVGNQTILRV